MPEETEAVDVKFEDAVAEEKENSDPSAKNAFMRERPQPQEQNQVLQAAGADQAPPKADTDDSETDEVRADTEEDMEILVPKIAAKEWTFGIEGDGDNPGIQRKYLQEELSVIGFAQWTGLVGEFLDDAMSGNNALTMSSLLSPPQLRTPGSPSISDFKEADVFVHALGKLVQFAPDFTMKSVCIWLDVPDYEWELVQGMMKRSPKNGGMSYDMFQEILEIFIDQNYTEINRFFRVRQRQIRNRFQARAKEASQSRSSKH